MTGTLTGNPAGRFIVCGIGYGAGRLTPAFELSDLPKFCYN